jgi:hypothetical protein
LTSSTRGRGAGSARACSGRLATGPPGLGHRELIAEVLAENAAMRTVLRRVFPMARTTQAGPELTITMRVDEAELDDLIDGLVA